MQPNKRSRKPPLSVEIQRWLQVLKNSNGVVYCEEPAPFTKPDGDFYLEVHHLRRLADGGTDTISNAVAVCPNCHRRLHFANDRDEVLADLYRRIDRLVEE